MWHILHTRQLVPVSKTTEYSEGYLHPGESIFVPFVPDFTRQNTQEASAKGLGLREQDH
jgi:hypothetical protein